MTTAFEEFKKSREVFLAQASEGKVTDGFMDDYSEAADTYFRKSLQESPEGLRLFGRKTPFALVALGGYGRKELCLHSDLDIMVLFNKKVPSSAAALAEDMLYPLWDLGLDIGHAFRTIQDCLSLSAQDFMVFTSLLDARFIGGSSPLFFSLLDRLREKVVPKRARPFFKWLEDMTDKRMAEFGDSAYLLEPNLKDGIGGLREYHAILWLGNLYFNAKSLRDLEYSGALSHREYEDLFHHLRFIWFTRNHLHALSGRKNDRLHFDFQPQMAKRMHFKGEGNLLPVEVFLGKLHASMSAVKSLYRSFVNGQLPDRVRPTRGKSPPRDVSPGLTLANNELCFDSATSILSRPMLLVEIFEKSADLDCPLSLEAKRLVREFLHFVDDDFRASEDAVCIFLSILAHPGTFKALDQMLETGLLEAFIPEFRGIRDHIQFDTYHLFPVGRHSLQTVKNLKSLSREKELFLLDIFTDLPDAESLLLSALFHDIGKNMKNHSIAGSRLTGRILKRFNYDKTLSKDVLFLIRNHLLLGTTATRRDLNDEKAVVDCARAVGTTRRLKMLYLLTWADARATGPRAWNEWIANLVQELFFKVLHVLEQGELATPRAGKKTKKTLTDLRHLLDDKIPTKDLEELLGELSLRYLLEVPAPRIARHLERFAGMGPSPRETGGSTLIIDAREEPAEGAWEVTVLAQDRPGLFADITGTFALHNINILSAHIYTWNNGTAADIFRVTPPLDALHPQETWEKIQKDLEAALQGRLSLPDRLNQKASRPSLLKQSRKSNREARVRIDAESSDFFTLVEVFADDRIGLLYDITRVLFENNVTTLIAKIATMVDQVADIFYIRTQEGEKVANEEHLQQIEKALLEVIRGDASPP